LSGGVETRETLVGPRLGFSPEPEYEAAAEETCCEIGDWNQLIEAGAQFPGLVKTDDSQAAYEAGSFLVNRATVGLLRPVLHGSVTC
jgi:hypothetical protein